MGVSSWLTTAADNDDADLAAGVDWREGQAPSTVNNSGRAMMKGIAELLKDLGGTIVSTGSTNEYTITTNVGYTALAENMVIVFEADKTSSGAATATVDGLTQKSIYRHNGAATQAGDIVDGGIYKLVYNSALDGFVGLNLASMTASSTSTLTNKTFNANGTGNSLSNVEVADFAASAIVTEAEGLASSDNDTSLPTTAAVKGYVDAATTGGALSVNVQVFTSNGTYTPTSGMVYCRVRIQAPGGGGGGADTDGASDDAEAGGGGGGEYAEGWFSAATIGASQAVTIGALGAAGDAATGGNGGTGGTTSLGALMTCIGGSGGTGANPGSGSSDTNSDGGAGGTGGSGGSIRIVGQRGGDASGTTERYGVGEGAYRSGGAAVLGIPGLVTNKSTGASGAPGAGTGYGYGGGGAKVRQVVASVAGGAGGAGVVIIEEFIQS